MKKYGKIIAIIMLVLMALSLIAYFITGKYLAVSVVCLIAFIAFALGKKKE